ncbi:peptidoglycan-binding protein [Ruegeria sediminis]|uniref:Peptidoglycan-binding protein n=1 Tax=Ruegeria sediminis TaxID=2583820 RepID=A0ABY2X0M6_9RHOB|nr:holin-associated N-acetylmuramidase [Ruegeria sediminis]TMV08800.1 peptidoglycan-binding protein [Ruegeria sediminis]
MQSVRQIAEEIVTREGGFVNDPDDPGGATKHGVTIHTLRRLGLDLTGDGEVGIADVKALSRAQAVEIFLTHYFHRPRIGETPEALWAPLFDMNVNAGPQAVRILQNLLQAMGYTLRVDGLIGPHTLKACRAAADPDAIALRDAYGVERRNFYFRLANKRPAARKYVRTRDGQKGGWIRRAEAFLSPRYHLSEDAFQRRIAAWG